MNNKIIDGMKNESKLTQENKTEESILTLMS